MVSALSRHRDAFPLTHGLYKLGQALFLLIIVPLVAFLPAPFAYGVACRYGDWAYGADKESREQILHLLEYVSHNRLSQAERKQITRDFFRRRACEAIDMMRLAGNGSALKRLVEIRGQEHLESALATGKGAIVCSAHAGFFNGGFSLLGACGFPITVVGDQRSRSDPGTSFFSWLFWQVSFKNRVVRHRQRPNIEPARGQVEAAVQIAHVLRSNEVIGMAIDVPIAYEDRDRAINVDFLDHRILLLPGGIILAEVTGAQILTMVMHRSTDWYHQILEITPVEMKDSTENIFKRCISIVEAPIHSHLAVWNGWENPKSLSELGLL